MVDFRAVIAVVVVVSCTHHHGYDISFNYAAENKNKATTQHLDFTNFIMKNLKNDLLHAVHALIFIIRPDFRFIYCKCAYPCVCVSVCANGYLLAVFGVRCCVFQALLFIFLFFLHVCGFVQINESSLLFAFHIRSGYN